MEILYWCDFDILKLIFQLLSSPLQCKFIQVDPLFKRFFLSSPIITHLDIVPQLAAWEKTYSIVYLSILLPFPKTSISETSFNIFIGPIYLNIRFALRRDIRFLYTAYCTQRNTEILLDSWRHCFLFLFLDGWYFSHQFPKCL